MSKPVSEEETSAGQQDNPVNEQDRPTSDEENHWSTKEVPQTWADGKLQRGNDFIFHSMEDLYMRCIRLQELKCQEQSRMLSSPLQDSTLDIESEKMRKLLKQHACLVRDFEEMLRRPILRTKGEALTVLSSTRKVKGLPIASRWRRYFRRYVWGEDVVTAALGAFAGYSLIAPMMLMQHWSQFWQRWIIVIEAILIFSAVIGYMLKGRDQAITATFAYAAVLVVFIGSGSSKAM